MSDEQIKRQKLLEPSNPIQISHSPTADTRSCDVTTVNKEQLEESSKMHINDVRIAMGVFESLLNIQSDFHDEDKLTDIDSFYRDFQNNFKTTDWWDRHRKLNRHHLSHPDGVPDDVTLVDVIEYICDCTVAGMARTGDVYPLKISDEVLRNAFNNTAAYLKRNIRVVKE